MTTEQALLHEMTLHIGYCADWGIPEDVIRAEPEAAVVTLVDDAVRGPPGVRHIPMSELRERASA